MAEILSTTSLNEKPQSGSLVADDDSVEFSKNKIDATQIQGAAISWRLTGSAQSGPLVIPATKVSIAMTLPADTFVINQGSGKSVKYKYTPSAKGSEDLDDKEQYITGEDIVLSGPGQSQDDPKKEVIDLTGNISGLNTQWVSEDSKAS